MNAKHEASVPGEQQEQQPGQAGSLGRGPDYVRRFAGAGALEGKVAVVTGGTRGIGLMIAEAYVRAGAKVYVSSRKADVVAETESALSQLGECIGIPADLSTEAECRRLADEISGRENQVHILVKNAGATWGAPIDEYDDVAFSKVLDLNVKGVFHLTKFLRPQLEAASTEDDPTSVINIGSIDGIQVPMMETYAYSSAKAAVHQLTRHLAKRLAPKVRVNAIAPGPFESKMMKATLESFRDSIEASAPMRRIGRPEDMAAAALYLASRGSAYVTGVILPVDGGIATIA
jgi:NAD(P)-dependent dehydrogenase (short-subunit alcohol dehydrogenase family)